MNVQRCKNGHYFDRDRYQLCPFCQTPAEPSSPSMSPSKHKSNVGRNSVNQKVKVQKTPGLYGVNSRLANGMKSLGEWFVFTVLVSGIPLIFYLFLSVFFGINERQGLSELAAFFFGITTPILFERQMGVALKENHVLTAVKIIIVFSFIFFCLFYGHIYIKDFRGEMITKSDFSTYVFIVCTFGGGCFILAGISQFFGGYYAE